jgi:hypothetical protein
MATVLSKTAKMRKTRKSLRMVKLRRTRRVARRQRRIPTKAVLATKRGTSLMLLQNLWDLIGDKPSSRASTRRWSLCSLKALNAVKPFGAQYGEKAEAWARVARYLKEDDDKERGRGKEARFGLVNVRNCKEKWNALSAEYASIAARSLRDSGTNPIVDARYIELEEAYLYEQSCLNTKTAKKSKRYHAQTQAVLNKTNGDRLLVASRTGPVQGWTVEGQEIASDLPMEEDPPLRFSTGSLSGTESDTN